MEQEKNPTIRYQKRFMVVRIHELKRTISSLEDKLRSLSASERHTQSLFLVIDQHWKIVCLLFSLPPLPPPPVPSPLTTIVLIFVILASSSSPFSVFDESSSNAT